MLTLFPIGALVVFLFSGVLAGLSIIQFSSSTGKRLALNSVYTFIFGICAAFIFNGIQRL
jgi:uncharacterized membrane protein YhfC